METKIIGINKLKNNTGQVEGLPKNPRFIKDDRYEKLKKSIKEFPEMMEMREVIAYDNNGELVVIAGNMRLRACKDLGIKEIFCKVLPVGTPIERLREVTVKDNVSFGSDDIDLLANEWDIEELGDWGLDLQDVSEPDLESKPDEPPPFDYQEAHCVLVTCDGEADQERIYGELVGMGFNCKVLVN
jgi:hypothetical protein